MTSRRTLMAMYGRMEKHYGPTGWWPAKTAFEVAVGAILVQNTNWTNVEKAIANLRDWKMLRCDKIAKAPIADLQYAIRPSGYFRVKAGRIQAFAQHLQSKYGGNMARMAKRPAGDLRRELLSIHGIGPETADCILLYACGKPVFVVDAYTRRILGRHGIVQPGIGYEALRAFFESRLDADADLFKEYHALIVMTAKEFCKKHPECDGCPLRPMLKPGQPLAL